MDNFSIFHFIVKLFGFLGVVSIEIRKQTNFYSIRVGA